MAEGTLQEIFREQAEREAWLERKYPWAEILRNWVLFILVIMLFISFVIWGIDIHTRNAYTAGKNEAYTEIADEQAKKEAAEEEQKKQEAAAEAELKIREAKAIARMWFGIRLIAEKNHYTNDDLITYAYCPIKRAEATGKTIEEVLAEKGQFTAYSEHNDLETALYELATLFIEDYHSGNLKPCDTRFQYAVFTDYGIWLVDDPNKTVPERWHV